MKRVLGLLIATSLCASAITSVAFAQQSTAQDRAIVIAQQRIFQGPEGAPMPPPPPGSDFVWIATENFSGKTVKRIDLDPDRRLVDVDRTNNSWMAQ